MRIKALLWSAVFGVLIAGCDDNDQSKSSIDELSPEVRGYLTMRISSANSLRMSGDAVVNESYQNLMSSVHGRSGGRMADDSVGVDPDTVIYDEPWRSCAVVTETINEDGSITYVYDYGDGCEEGWGDYKYIMHGKYTYTYKYDYSQEGSVYKYDYEYAFEYDNYGGQYYYDSVGWYNDGYSNGKGSSLYDTANHKFTGNYTYDGIMEYGYGHEPKQRYSSKGKSQYDERGGVISENDYEYGNEENYYSSKVTRPLVSDYTCNQEEFLDRYVWIYVSGREAVHYKQDGKEGSFEVDYGNGECDNIIYIIENGERTEVDLGDAIFFCGDIAKTQGG
ncbi:MAG TPA: hypothetical protein VGK59_17355 [Ohtaekwangia sp.]